MLDAGAGSGKQLAEATNAGQQFMIQSLLEGRDVCNFLSHGGREYWDMVAKDDRIDAQLQFFNYNGDALRNGFFAALSGAQAQDGGFTEDGILQQATKKYVSQKSLEPGRGWAKKPSGRGM